MISQGRLISSLSIILPSVYQRTIDTMMDLAGANLTSVVYYVFHKIGVMLLS